jgi:hypothetical protein
MRRALPILVLSALIVTGYALLQRVDPGDYEDRAADFFVHFPKAPTVTAITVSMGLDTRELHEVECASPRNNALFVDWMDASELPDESPQERFLRLRAAVAKDPGVLLKHWVEPEEGRLAVRSLWEVSSTHLRFFEIDCLDGDRFFRIGASFRPGANDSEQEAIDFLDSFHFLAPATPTATR